MNKRQRKKNFKKNFNKAQWKQMREEFKKFLERGFDMSPPHFRVSELELGYVGLMHFPVAPTPYPMDASLYSV